MSDKINKLKLLIEEWEELRYELDRMSDDWYNGSPEAAAMSDPSDQYLKGMELEDKYKEIKDYTKSL